ncbi:MAG TPA: cytochrome P450 [Ilumatobacteraceae bacterium]|nr:cytochrome P450 [Ilumatobacteraceae bacterium]
MATVPFPAHDPAYLSDPYSWLADMRRQGSHFVESATGKWSVLGADDVEFALSKIERGTTDSAAERNVHFPANPFQADGPGHAGPRRLIAPALTNRAVQKFRLRAQQLVDDALAGRERGGELRVVEEIGFKLPYQLTNDLLGIPDVDNAAELRDWTWKVLDLIDAFPTPEQFAANIAAAQNLAGHIAEVAAWKRNHLGDDLFSTVIAAGDAGEIMRPEQVVPYIHTLYLAGMHTTVNQISLSLWALLTDQDQWDLLVAQPNLLDNAIEELLRFEPTAQYMVRVPEQDTPIGDFVVPAGANVVCWIASANRDERRWGPTANQLDITRDARNHIAFGKGAHTCIGSWLARLELNVVLGTIIGRYPATQLPDQEMEWVSNVIRGPRELLLDLRMER